MTPERAARLLERFPRVQDLAAEQQAALAREEEEWAARQREWQAAAEQAKAEGKPAPRPLKREESRVHRHHGPTFRVPREDLVDLCRWLRDNPEFDMAFLEFVSAIDWPDRVEVVYCLRSLARQHGVTLKVPLPRDDLRVPSVTGVWRGADWKGHPLRKDYVYEDPQWLVDVATQRQREIAATGEEWEGRGSRS